MKKGYYLSISLVLLVLLTGCSVHRTAPTVGKVAVADDNKEYKLVYENPIDGNFIEKKVSISDVNIEEQIIYELFKLENIPQNLLNAFNSRKLKVLKVEYVEEEKKVKIDFNKELLNFEKSTDNVRYFRSAIYNTLAQFTTVEYVEIYIEGKFIDGLSELVLSGEIHRDK